MKKIINVTLLSLSISLLIIRIYLIIIDINLNEKNYLYKSNLDKYYELKEKIIILTIQNNEYKETEINKDTLIKQKEELIEQKKNLTENINKLEADIIKLS